MKREECPHPSWITKSDGHTEYWYECSKCGEITYWAPWLFNRKSEID